MKFIDFLEPAPTASTFNGFLACGPQHWTSMGPARNRGQQFKPIRDHRNSRRHERLFGTLGTTSLWAKPMR
eukprot:12898632-Alexandrium_andersonii.AAC.1